MPDNAMLGKQAHDDLQRGLVDTDRAPVLDRLYRNQIAKPRRRA